MDKIQVEKATISFKVNGKPVRFTVYHNLKTFGLDMENAVTCWLARTDTYTAEDLCTYINNKNTGARCISENEYLKILAC